jgi:hypothetical protein
MGAAAAGVVAVSGVGVFSAVTGATAATPPLLSSPDTPTLEGSGIVAHVDNAKTGQISIFVGDRTISYVNVDLAQALMRAAL